MIILGIDPGYAILGFGVVKTQNGGMSAVDYGVIETQNDMSFPERLEKLYLGTRQLCDLFHPDHIAFEELFFARNAKTAIAVGSGRGVSLLAAQQYGVPLYEYTPMQVKLAVTGNGHADKKQVQQMAKMLLSLSSIPKPDDAADALGVAICHANTIGPAAEQFRIK